jgi:hypothetical protein
MLSSNQASKKKVIAENQTRLDSRVSKYPRLIGNYLIFSMGLA